MLAFLTRLDYFAHVIKLHLIWLHWEQNIDSFQVNLQLRFLRAGYLINMLQKPKVVVDLTHVKLLRFLAILI